MKKIFELKLLLGGTGSKDELLTAIHKALTKCVAREAYNVEEQAANVFLLKLSGSREAVDQCRTRLLNGLPSRTLVAHLTDDLGDEQRKHAYEVLAQVEQQLRAFVAEAAANELGLDWWNRLGEQSISETASSRQDSETIHPLEFTDFGQLVDLLTAPLRSLSPSQPLTAQDLATLLSAADTLDALRSTLEEQLQQKTLWSEVFGKLFQDENSWHEARSDLKKLVPLRNKVMHHRPISLFEVAQLRKHAKNVLAVLSGPRRVLRGAERLDLRDVARSALLKLPPAEDDKVRMSLQSLRDHIVASHGRAALDDPSVIPREMLLLLVQQGMRTVREQGNPNNLSREDLPIDNSAT